MNRILYLILALFSTGIFAQNQTLFEQGNKLYNDGNMLKPFKNMKRY